MRLGVVQTGSAFARVAPPATKAWAASVKKTAALSLAVAAAISGQANGFDAKGSAGDASVLSGERVALAGDFFSRRLVPPFAARSARTVVSSAV
jgi:hypothetical protein